MLGGMIAEDARLGTRAVGPVAAGSVAVETVSEGTERYDDRDSNRRIRDLTFVRAESCGCLSAMNESICEQPTHRRSGRFERRGRKQEPRDERSRAVDF